MSRVAKKPIPLPKGVDCLVKAGAITVKGHERYVPVLAERLKRPQFKAFSKRLKGKSVKIHTLEFDWQNSVVWSLA